jgi:hypothetical protein
MSRHLPIADLARMVHAQSNPWNYTRAARLTRIAKSRLSLGELAADAGEPIRALPGGQFPVE